MSVRLDPARPLVIAPLVSSLIDLDFIWPPRIWWI